jgi:hypothetical protein
MSTAIAEWTVALLDPAGDRFRRVNLSLTRAQAQDLACFVYDVSGVDVWAVRNRRSELARLVPVEDIGNVLDDDGNRVPIVEGGQLPFRTRDDDRLAPDQSEGVQ